MTYESSTFMYAIAVSIFAIGGMCGGFIGKLERKTEDQLAFLTMMIIFYLDFLRTLSEELDWLNTHTHFNTLTYFVSSFFILKAQSS